MKQWMKKMLARGWQRKYDRLLEKKTVSYDTWIKNREMERTEEGDDGSPLTVKQVPYEACTSFCLGKVLEKETADIILFVDSGGRASDGAEQEVAGYFSAWGGGSGAADRMAAASAGGIAAGGVQMLYGDEDVLSPEGIRYTPWLKPDWSPDTFLSFFYFGSIFAVRTELLRQLTTEEKKWILDRDHIGEDVRNGIYSLCYVLARKCGGFEKRRGDAGETEGWGFPIGHLDEVLFHGKVNREMGMGREGMLDVSGMEAFSQSAFAGENAGAAERKLSVVIPSKDNPEILKRCIRSLMAEAAQGTGDAYEVILVDNGSREAARKELEKWLEESGISFRYLYQEMPFHFSKMCNLGAEAAEGDVLLFLNDDVEFPEGTEGKTGSLLDEMCRMARRPYTGAVGAKLYYPDSARIQHAGIVNLRLGPVHKLQFKEDRMNYYYGWNRGKRNVIAVTGACLAVEKKKFLEAGGFPEELPVAFNDVDLCFSLFEKGYYNVVLQDMPLYHHESLSRGNDDDKEKLLRLLREKDKLYERHPGLYGKDPFYHKYLAGDMLSTGFELKAEYEPEKEELPVRTMDTGELERGTREDGCVMISLEYAGPAADFGGRKDKTELLIQGYCFISGSDNALFEKWILLKPEEDAEKNGGKLSGIRPEPLRRKDVEDNLPDQVHVGLSGFCAVIDGRELAKGSYRIGILAKDRCSRQKLYAWTNRYLEI